MVLIQGYRPQIMALDIIFLFQFAFIWFLLYCISASGQYCPIYEQIGEVLRAAQRQLIEMLLVLRCSLRLKAKRGTFATPIEFAAPILSFREFFLAALRLLAVYESQHQQYWRSIKETKKQAKRGHLFAALRLLLQKQPANFAVLIGNGIMFNARRW